MGAEDTRSDNTQADVTDRGRWLAEERADLATDRILDAAAELFSRDGIRATTMAEVAAAAGCSRATLYNHFEDREALELAFVNREAIRLSRRVAELISHIAEPTERIRCAFTATLDGVRNDERLTAWFGGDNVGIATATAADSEVLDAIAGAFAGSLAPPLAAEDLRRRARFVLRMVLSLLAMPEPDPAEESVLVDQFVVPALTDAAPTTG